MIPIVSATEGSPTSTGGKRRSRAGSFSMWVRYSSSVVAPTARRSPRASIGFSRLPAETAPSAAPAPTIVWSSSMKRMIWPSLEVISERTALSRSSNSPRYFAPATSAPTSSAQTRLPSSPDGTSPATIRCARPSGIAACPAHATHSLPPPRAYRRLSAPGLADEHGVVLRAAREHLDGSANLLVPPDHGIELPLLGERREVSAGLLESLVGAFRVLRRHPLPAAHVLERAEQRVAGDDVEREQQVLDGDEFGPERRGLVEGVVEDAAETRARLRLPGAPRHGRLLREATLRLRP